VSGLCRIDGVPVINNLRRFVVGFLAQPFESKTWMRSLSVPRFSKMLGEGLHLKITCRPSIRAATDANLNL
jgi:hypothetical protein